MGDSMRVDRGRGDNSESVRVGRGRGDSVRV